MAGNIQPDNSGNIYVEFDYNNIIVVDPNKTTDAFGKISERLVDHENLVMYANLEAELLPRTKLAVGVTPQDRINIVSIAKMDFLKPTKDSFLGSGYYDDLTGENTTKFMGNGQMFSQTVVPQDGSKPYVQDRPKDLNRVLDNGLLGITNITVDTNLSFIPTVRISLEDVQGRALFQLGNNSPYAAFFNLPYPPFYLTLKGFYGQAVRYQLNLEKFHARFNTFSGNYQIDLDFKGYKFNVLNEISVGHLIATPHMYSQQYNVTVNPVGPQQSDRAQESNANTQARLLNATDGRQDENTVQVVSERGYQKVKEVYSEYKSKALIPPDFPELTLVQFINKLDMFEQNIANKFSKADVEPLTQIRTYKEILRNYFLAVRSGEQSWFGKYINPAPVILNNKERVFIYKNLNIQTKENATKQLQSIVNDYNGQLGANTILGIAGKTPIPNPIKFDTIRRDAPSFSQIDWSATTKSQTGILSPSKEDIDKVIQNYNSSVGLVARQIEGQNGQNTFEETTFPVFQFEGEGRFDKQITFLETQANKKLSSYEDALTKKLLEKIENGVEGIGFKPTVRNIIAVIMASAEAFIRLLDDVHENAWRVKYDPIRKRAILFNPSSAPGSDTVDDLKLTQAAIEQDTGLKFAEIPVYPWPQFFVETPEDNKGRFQLKYIADPSVVEQTEGWNFSKWPEVEFVEEYMKGLTQKFNPPLEPPPLDNERETNIININAIEFPTQGVAYANKEEIKFFYEIWERQFLTSRYSNYVRVNANQIDELITLNTEAEASNIISSLGISAPSITTKLKNYALNSTNYLGFLRSISNDGTGRAWQEFTRDFFVTPYIRNLTENSFSILPISEFGKIPLLATSSTALQKIVKNSTNNPNITDTYPFTNTTWVQNNMANGVRAEGTDVYNTNRVLTIYEPRKVISNFNDVYNFNVNRPVTNFSYRVIKNPYTQALSFEEQQINLNTFFRTRQNPNDFVVTEGYYEHTSPQSTLSLPLDQQFPLVSSTSMLNTPYMVNAIQNGVQNNRNNVTYPYVQAAYLFINSLPLATLKEKYKSQVDNNTTELDYIASCFKKFGAIHKLPYAWILKMGSVWHRYKVFKQTNTDILDTVWRNFDYTTNFSPIQNSKGQSYSFQYNGVQRKITLENETLEQVKIQTGFYPKVINDFYNFFTGYEVYRNYTDSEIQNTINGGMKVFNFAPSNITAKQGEKNLELTTWSVLIPGVVENQRNCDPKNNTLDSIYYIVPSFGSAVNQTTTECIINQTTQTPSTVVNLTDNSAMYNGSVRLLWSAPNYGYFDNSQILKPTPEQYLTRIDNQSEIQSPFSLLSPIVDDEGNPNRNYSEIEEIFSVFEKRILDSFEQEFLNFCKPITDQELPVESTEVGSTTVSLNANFRNFQSLFRSILSVIPKQPSVTENQYFTNVINEQYSNFQNTIRSFLEYDILFRYGNPSNYRRRIFDSYLSYNSTPQVTDPINFQPYVQGSLPSRGGNVTLSSSRTQNPAAWFALETEVGFSTIPNLAYSSTGSYITDFFIDNNIQFTADNVTLLNPLIKMYATYKLNNQNQTGTQTATAFREQIQFLFNSEDLIQNNFLNQLLTRLNADLPQQYEVPQANLNSVITGEQSKVENWEVFKALNDKWIAGGDYKTKTLFEDILFLDRASRNIGQTVLIDIFDLRNMMSKNSLNNVMSVFTLISGILIKNNFTVMNLPAYVNFYNVQDVDGTTIPQTEGSLEFADNLWGTFLNVDYRKATSKMVCFYVGKPSQYLDLPKGNFRFRDDAFEMRRASENPLLENQNGKKDWALSNRCVGFNVDIGTRNQNIFYSFQVDQQNGAATSESINTMLNMVDQSTGRNVATQNVGLYNLYKQRSYKATVVCLGNALIQPSMYFNLRHVPMFNGPYLIQSIQHTIQPGNFQTTFTGVRQGIFDLPSIDSFLQSMNQNLLTRLEEILKIKKDEPRPLQTTEQDKANNTIQEATGTIDAQNSCTTKVDLEAYQDFEVNAGVSTTITLQQFANELKTALPNESDRQLRVIIYCISYVTSYVKSSNSGSGTLVGWNNNYGLISLENNFTDRKNDFAKSYCCVNVVTGGKSSSLPIVAFDSIQKYIKFMADSLRNNVARILRTSLVKYYVCHWPKNNNVSESYFDSNITEFSTVIRVMNDAVRSSINVKLENQDEGQQYLDKNKETQDEAKTPGVTPTPTPLKPNPGQTCPPPTISSFAPIEFNSGSVVQIIGRNLDTTTRVLINQTPVNPSDIRIIDAQTVRIIIPNVSDVLTQGNITIETFYGSFTTVQQFTYNPALQPASSPGSFVNGATGLNSTNTNTTNPQETEKPLMISEKTKFPNSQIDEKLVVKMSPDFPPANILTNVLVQISVFRITFENNIEKKKLVQNGSTVLTNNVQNNEFTITNAQLRDLLITNPIPPFNTQKLANGDITEIQFTLQARPINTVLFPSNIQQSFNFTFV